ncbi:MAG TPA: tail fiber protein [Candidatus Binataceae bacterium]|nr:tail fiber protein [Candidatus Binataceae bacterium]
MKIARRIAATLGLAAIFLLASAQSRYTPPAGGVPSGACVPYVGTTAPGGWYFAYGQAVTSATDPTLYALVGTTFGAAGTMPDLRGRVAAGADAMGGVAASRLGSGATGGVTVAAVLGAAGGQQSHTLTSAEQASMSVSASGSATGAFGTVDTSGTGPNIVPNAGAAAPAFNLSVSVTGTASGGGGAHNVVQPTLVLNYICKR